MKKKFGFRGWDCFWVVALFFIFPVEGRAMSILSLYGAPFPASQAQEASIIWKVSDEAEAGGGRVLRFQPAKAAGCRAELFFNRSNRLLCVKCYRFVRGQERLEVQHFQSGLPALIDETLIPVDWFNLPLPFRPIDKKIFVLEKKIGLATFVCRVEIVVLPVRWEEALSSGMLRKDAMALDDEEENRRPLYLVELKALDSPTRKVLLSQLWREGDSFWLYECKQNRRSWRLLGLD